jgi:hypothetical protein
MRYLLLIVLLSGCGQEYNMYEVNQYSIPIEINVTEIEDNDNYDYYEVKEYNKPVKKFKVKKNKKGHKRHVG